MYNFILNLNLFSTSKNPEIANKNPTLWFLFKKSEALAKEMVGYILCG